MALRTAEMIKYACNAFHAVKISFANEIGALAGELGIDGAEVMDTLCRDHALNISRAYLKPGFAFGGSCLPKDLRALVYRASRLDLKLPLLEAVLPSNNAQLDRAIALALDLPVRADRRVRSRVQGEYGRPAREPGGAPAGDADRQGPEGACARSAHPARRDLWQQPALHHERDSAYRQPARRPAGRHAGVGRSRARGAKAVSPKFKRAWRPPASRWWTWWARSARVRQPAPIPA